MDKIVVQGTAFIILTVISLTVAKVDSIGLIVRIAASEWLDNHKTLAFAPCLL